MTCSARRSPGAGPGAKGTCIHCHEPEGAHRPAAEEALAEAAESFARSAELMALSVALQGAPKCGCFHFAVCRLESRSLQGALYCDSCHPTKETWYNMRLVVSEEWSDDLLKPLPQAGLARRFRTLIGAGP